MAVTYLLLGQQVTPTVLKEGVDWLTPLVAMLGIAVAVLTALRVSGDAAKDRRAQRQHEQARQYAEALSTAIAWGEIPYRVARRTSDDPATLQVHVLHIHELQERITFHSQWLRVESPEIADAYDDLVRAIKRLTLPNAQDAWNRAPLTSGREMNIGALYACDVSTECNAFVTAVRRELNLTDGGNAN